MEYQRRTKEDNYSRHLQLLSDEELESLIAGYEAIDPYQKLIDVSNRIFDYCNTHQARIRWYDQIKTIETRLLAYRRGSPKVDASNVYQLSNKLSNLIRNPVLVTLTPELREDMILSLLSIQNLSFANRIENYLGIRRQQLLQAEIIRREKLLERGIYINRCVEIIGHEEAMEMTEEEIIKLIHVQNYKRTRCNACLGQIHFDKIYKSKRGHPIYIIPQNLNICTGILVEYFQCPERSGQPYSLDNPVPARCCCSFYELS